MKLACGVLNNSRFSQKHRDRIISLWAPPSILEAIAHNLCDSFVDMLSVVNEADRKLNISTRLGSSDYNALCMVAEQQVANLDVVCKNWRSVLCAPSQPAAVTSLGLLLYRDGPGAAFVGSAGQHSRPYVSHSVPCASCSSGRSFRTIILAYAVLPLSALNIVPATPQRLHLALQAVESAKACLREVAAAPQIAQAPCESFLRASRPAESSAAFAHELCLVLCLFLPARMHS
jgi:hypothetical protein